MLMSILFFAVPAAAAILLGKRWADGSDKRALILAAITIAAGFLGILIMNLFFK